MLQIIKKRSFGTEMVRKCFSELVRLTLDVEWNTSEWEFTEEKRINVLNQ